MNQENDITQWLLEPEEAEAELEEIEQAQAGAEADLIQEVLQGYILECK
jgi:hypothetical protein